MYYYVLCYHNGISHSKGHLVLLGILINVYSSPLHTFLEIIIMGLLRRSWCQRNLIQSTFPSSLCCANIKVFRKGWQPRVPHRNTSRKSHIQYKALLLCGAICRQDDNVCLHDWLSGSLQHPTGPTATLREFKNAPLLNYKFKNDKWYFSCQMYMILHRHKTSHR